MGKFLKVLFTTVLFGQLTGVAYSQSDTKKSPAQSQEPDKQTCIELVTSGSVSVTGIASGQPGMQTPANRNRLDTLVYWKENADGIRVYSKRDNARQYRSHEQLQVAVPSDHRLDIRAVSGPVTLTDVEGRVHGKVDSGSVTLSAVKGRTDFFTGHGNVTVRQCQADGFVMTQKGDILLEDAGNQMFARTQEGKVTRKYTKAYFQRFQEPDFTLSTDHEDVVIETLSRPASLTVKQGNVRMDKVTNKLELRLEEAPAVLGAVEAAVRINGRKSNVQLDLSPQSLQNTEPVEITLQDGAVTLTVPAGFAGKLIVDQVQTGPTLLYGCTNALAPAVPKTATWPYPQSIPAENQTGSQAARPTKDAAGKIIGHRTSFEQIIGNGAKVIRLNVLNGTIMIKQN